jgi:hypothetical protein
VQRWSGPDADFAAVALAPSGTTALVRDVSRRQWRYELSHEARPLRELQALRRLLLPSDAERESARAIAIDATLRKELREQDRGAPVALPSIPPSSSRRAEAELEPRFVDLRPSCNLSLEQTEPGFIAGFRLDRLLAPGRQHLAGVDFELLCGVRLAHAPTAMASVAAGTRVEGLAVRQAHAAAVQLLVLAPTQLQDRGDGAYATLEYVYRDGTRERASLHYGRDLVGWWALDFDPRSAAMRVAYSGLGAQYGPAGMHLRPPGLFAVRAPNPHPERILESLALESTPQPWSAPILLAATLDPAF